MNLSWGFNQNILKYYMFIFMCFVPMMNVWRNQHTDNKKQIEEKGLNSCDRAVVIKRKRGVMAASVALEWVISVLNNCRQNITFGEDYILYESVIFSKIEN